MTSTSTERLWRWAFWGAALAVLIRNLTGLESAPPGLYLDEASIGYNAWSILHHGVDEHGASFPLYFSAFGEYKNPLYIYTVVPVMAVLGPTVAAVRLPAALFGWIAAVALGDAGRRITGSRAVGVATLLVSAATPWLSIESRVGFEVISMVACIAVMLWCLSCLGGTHDRLAFSAAGVAAALAVFAYSTGRVEMALLGAASLVCWGRTRRMRREWLSMAVPGAAGFLVLVSWMLRYPGALTARFGAISITSDNPSLITAAGRFVSGYVTYFSPSFLFLRGDENPRHNTGYEGMLLVTLLPLLVAGLVILVRRWREPLPRFVLLGVLLGPVSAALTQESVPHALRDADSLPFLLLTCVYGAAGLLPLLRTRRPWVMALLVAMAIEVTGLQADMFGSWPERSVFAFDVPDRNGVLTARARVAPGHTVWLSDQLPGDQIEARFIALPDPPDHDIGQASVPLEVQRAGFAIYTGPGSGPSSGDTLVLLAGEAPPAGAVLIEQETVPVTSQGLNAPETRQVPYVAVYRMT